MNKIFRSVSGLVFLLAVAVSAAAAPAAPVKKQAASPYTISVIPFYSPEKIWQLYSPLIEFLKKKTGKPWELKLYHSHDALIEGLCGGEVSFALLGPVPLGRANRKCGAVPLAVALGKDGKPSYRSVIVTGEPSVVSLQDIRGRRFAFFKGSTAAHIVPAKMLQDAGLGPDAYDPVMLESQDRIMNALLKREVAAAGVKESLFRKFKDEPLSILSTSGPLPNFAFCALPSVSPAARQAFLDTLLPIRPLAEPADAPLTATWDDEIKNGFIAPPAGYLESVSGLAEITRSILHENR